MYDNHMKQQTQNITDRLTLKKFQCVTTTRWFSVLPGSHRQ